MVSLQWFTRLGVESDKFVMNFSEIQFYKKASNVIRKKGFEVYSYEEYEYESYFMKDGMHLGWKG
nr:D-alanyl-lipoteichoic acid biosynthesis protein DltD [Clostridium tepidum]